MYDYLEGRVAARGAARLVLDVQGVGYELAIPISSSFPAAGPLKVWTHLVVREDSHQIYAFRDAATRDAFRALLTVGGVGPKVALAVLSGLTRTELAAAILSGDVARLTSVRGVGRRTAEQILLDLRDKAVVLGGEAAEGSAAASRGERVQIEDAVAALVSIGYSEKDARKQVERASKQVDPADLERLVRAALQG